MQFYKYGNARYTHINVKCIALRESVLRQICEFVNHSSLKCMTTVLLLLISQLPFLTLSALFAEYIIECLS